MPDSQDIADRLEFVLWAANKSKSKTSLKEDIQALLAGADSEEAASLANEVFECLTERKAMLKERYPYQVSISRIEALPLTTEGIVYIFCLALSVVPYESITARMRDFVFECLAGAAATSYFGGTGIQTGANWSAHGHESYGDMVHEVSALIKELGKPKTEDQPGGGDAGWDVILVNNFLDNMYPRLIVGGNCATGKTDWLKKGNETVFPHWFRHFFGKEPDGPYFEFFAAPFAADDDQRSRKTGKETFLFDRFRLAEHGKEHNGMSGWLEKKARPEAVNIALL